MKNKTKPNRPFDYYKSKEHSCARLRNEATCRHASPFKSKSRDSTVDNNYFSEQFPLHIHSFDF